MPTQGVNGAAVAAAGAGALLVWSGIRGTRVTAALKELISGQQPSGAEAYPLSAPGGTGGATNILGMGAGSPAGSTTGQAIAADALQYVGHPYLFGGAPGTSGQQPWDCSSFVNWVLGHDLRLAIPGSATYNGSVHGPNTLMYLAWPGAVTIGHDGSAAVPGDLCVWQTHMGIATGAGKMVSARSATSNPPTGTDTINGDIPGEILFVRRLKAAVGGQPTLGDVRARVRGATGG
jgi:cell wall-associated NlpC family hydrolase